VLFTHAGYIYVIQNNVSGTVSSAKTTPQIQPSPHQPSNVTLCACRKRNNDNFHSTNQKLSIKAEPGITFRAPFFSNVTMYKQIMTASFEERGKTDTTIRGEVTTLSVPNPPEIDHILINRTLASLASKTVRFADTYVGQIPASFRFKLPLDPVRMTKLHKDFRSEENLQATLLERNARDVTVVTATQCK
jgi:hypothetical protein